MEMIQFVCKYQIVVKSAMNETKVMQSYSVKPSNAIFVQQWTGVLISVAHTMHIIFMKDVYWYVMNLWWSNIF